MISFNLCNIKVNQFAILDPNPAPQGQIESRFIVQAENELHSIRLQLTCDYMSEDKKVLTLQVSCTFVIKDESWQACTKDGHVVIPRGFLVHLAVLTVGTARGILYERTADTLYQKVYLPLINVDKMFDEDFVI